MPKLRYELVYLDDDFLFTVVESEHPLWQCETPGCVLSSPSGFSQTPRYEGKEQPTCEECGKLCRPLMFDTDTGMLLTLPMDPLAAKLLEEKVDGHLRRD
jgi:hypothetical protein